MGVMYGQLLSLAPSLLNFDWPNKDERRHVNIYSLCVDSVRTAGYGLVRGKPYELVLDATSRRVWKGSKMTDWTFGNGRHGPKLYGYLTQDGWARQMFSMPGERCVHDLLHQPHV